MRTCVAAFSVRPQRCPRLPPSSTQSEAVNVDDSIAYASAARHLLQDAMARSQFYAMAKAKNQLVHELDPATYLRHSASGAPDLTGGPGGTPNFTQTTHRFEEDGALMKNPLARADEVVKPGPDPHQPAARHPRNVRVIPKSRDFH